MHARRRAATRPSVSFISYLDFTLARLSTTFTKNGPRSFFFLA